MIKEKHEKGPDTSSTAIKEETTNTETILNKNIDNADTRIKTEEETATSSCSGGVSKDCTHPQLTKNGATVIGSTNTGSVHNLVDRKDPLLLEGGTEEGNNTENASLIGMKTEEGIEGSKLPQDAFSNMGCSGGVPGPIPSHPPPPDGVQPLASNIVNKQSSVEVQYMQQQSQIFVFSTQLANKGAEAVFQGQYPSIIAYHCAQPGTKKYLEKNPLKITQFNRQNPAQWLNNLAMMKNQKGCTRSPSMMGKGNNMEGFLVSESLEDMVGLSDSVDLPWDQKPNSHMVGIDGISNGGPMLPEVDSSCQMRSSPGSTIPLGHSPIMTSASSASPSLASMQPSLQGVKVPDENLTPQQRQHREEQLATIRKMQQMLFPEHQAMGIPPDGSTPGGDQSGSEGGAPTLGPGPMDVPPGSEICGDNISQGGPGGMMGPGQMGPGMMGPQRPMNMPIGTTNPGNMPMAQMEWQKLQSQFFEERKGRGQTNMVPSHNAPSMVSRVGPGPGPRLQGPPPPYHQTPRSASVPIALQSPSPASPNNPTSNLSLPSPRASSALNSPADPGRTFNLNRHLNTGQSPTSQDSPSTGRGGLIPSNPSTPISSHLSPNSNLIVSTSQDFPPTSGLTPTSSTDGLYNIRLLAQHKNIPTSVPSSTANTTLANKEPNLMPVPSPQQIQYLNTFEGQELTIQKQPNTSLKDGNMISPSLISTSIDTGFTGVSTDITARLSGPNTPMTPSSIEMGPRFPSTTASNDGCRYQIASPQTSSSGNTLPSSSDKNPRTVSGSCLSPQGVRTPGCQSDLNKSGEMQSVPFGTSSPHGMVDMQRFPGPSSVGPTTSPVPFNQQNQQQAKIGGNFMNISPSSKGPPPGMDLPVSTNYGCNVRSDNLPLNPNSTSSMPGNPKVSHFDPISSLAQMSQQLTNSVASTLNGQNQNPANNMMNFNSPGMHGMGVMDMGGCHGLPELEANPAQCNMMMPMHPSGHPGHPYHPGNPGGNSPMATVRSLSPKIGPNPGGPPGIFPPGSMPIPRMMGRGPGCNPYNGANVQVKPSAPNTIQYLPAKPQMGNSNPRGPPSLDFLQRYANPPVMPNMDNKMGGQQMNYFSNCGPPNNGHMGAGNMNPMGHMDGPPMPPDGPMGMGAPMMNGGPMNNGPMMGGPPNMGMGGGMMPQGAMGMNMPPMMRGPNMRPVGVIRMPHMSFNGPTNGGGPPVDPNMFPGPNMNNPNAQMFVSGPKSSPMGMGAPDASQPLPPSIGQSSSFKNSPFVGPTTADPNYAQQFHNFQQQLYATTTRSQMSNQGMGPGPGGPGPPHSTGQQYYVQK